MFLSLQVHWFSDVAAVRTRRQSKGRSRIIIIISQPAADRVFTGANKCDHVTPAVRSSALAPGSSRSSLEEFTSSV